MQTAKWDAFRKLQASRSFRETGDPFHPLNWADSYCNLICSPDFHLRPKE
jgi:hypothetical protein